MSDENDDSQKTEDPTPKRLQEAREKGQVATSREINSWFAMLSGLLIVYLFAPGVAGRLEGLLRRFVEQPHQVRLDPSDLQGGMFGTVSDVLIIIAPVLAIPLLAAMASALQTGVLFSTETISPKGNRISPLSGLKRLFSARSLAEFVKGLIKLAIVGVVAAAIIWPELANPTKWANLDSAAILPVIAMLTVKVAAGVVGVMTVVAALDLLYQRLMMFRELRMSRRELLDELKQTEGDPYVKARLRRIRMERARRRMMQEVPKADVVITNPTHFAVALKYDQETMAAPQLVAKGADLVAARIRALAEEHQVPIVQNPPLARALYATVELDQEIPPDHYRAVAEVISFVLKQRQRAGARS